MDDNRADEIVKVANELRAMPDRLGWTVTSIIYGHGKVIVQTVTPRGKCKQFTKKV